MAHLKAVSQYVGAHWSEEVDQHMPVPLLSFYVSVITRHLIPKNPRVMLSTFASGHKPVVSGMQQWSNETLDKIKYSDTIRRVVMDGLFSCGIAKVALTTPMDSVMDGWQSQSGSVGIWPINLEDFAFDPNARDLNQAAWIAHRYRAPLAVVKANKNFDSKLRNNLTVSTDPRYNTEGDEKTSVLGRGIYGADREEYEDMVDLWEVYCRRENCIVTIENDQISESGLMVERALGQQPWIGPPCGPYHFLGFGWVPANAMPKGPIQDLLDLHTALNRLYRKIIRQADRQKTITFVQGSADEDGNRIIEASDGDVIRVNDPKNIQVVSFGGADQVTFATAEALKMIFNEMGGNLQLLGGIAPQSGTASQDKMLNANASTGVADKQAEVLKFVESTVEALCWYWYHDPFKVMRMNHSVPGMSDISITRQITPEDRLSGSWDDLQIKVDPYSMQYSTPGQRAATLTQIMQQVVLPTLPLLQQQQKGVDLGKFLEKLAEYLDQPDLPEIITIQEPVQQTAGQGRGPGMPQSSQREYTRHNVPARTERGDAMNRINTMLGIDTGGDPNRNGQTQPMRQ